MATMICEFVAATTYYTLTTAPGSSARTVAVEYTYQMTLKNGQYGQNPT